MARDTTPTDRRGYERPVIGADWAEAWDELVEDQDELSIERGPIANRPTTGTYDDELYLAVDQRTLWRWDEAASDWEAAAGLGTSSDPIPGTSHFESLSAGSLGNDGSKITLQDDLIAPNGTGGLRLDSALIPDDDVATIDSQGKSIVFISSASSSGFGSGMFFTSFNSIKAANQESMSNEGSTTLSGTTGPDDSLNIAVESNTIYLENRTGGEQRFMVTQLGG